MYRIEWIWSGVPIGALTLLVVPVVGPMVALIAVLITVAVVVFALVKAIVATPFVIARAVRRHRQSERAVPSSTAATVRRPSLLTPAGPHAAAPKSA